MERSKKNSDFNKLNWRGRAFGAISSHAYKVRGMYIFKDKKKSRQTSTCTASKADAFVLAFTLIFFALCLPLAERYIDKK